jgi:predicted AAA+ superfamily ATPase
MLNNRTLKTSIERVSSNFRAILVTGMRQVGKTTLLKMLSEQERTYITLDDTATLNLAKTDPYLFFKTYPTPMLIDEIQYAPDL